jgi:hypothetical protein
VITSDYENDFDIIAVTNLNGRGSLSLSTTPQGCEPESMSGTLAIYGGGSQFY